MAKQFGIAKLRLSPREMVPNKYVSKELTIEDMKAIREELENKTRSTFEDFDRAKRRTYSEIDSIRFD